MTWRDRAECRDANPEIFFVSSAGRGYATKATTLRAFAYCDRCQVRAECLAYAIKSSRNDHGVWGGMTSTQRMRLRQAALRTPTAPADLVSLSGAG